MPEDPAQGLPRSLILRFNANEGTSEPPNYLYRELDWQTGKFTAEHLFTEEQMRSYALAAVEAERAERAEWRDERAMTLRMLRSLCEDFGDNDFPDNLHLSDALEKHLGRYLWQDEELSKAIENERERCAKLVESQKFYEVVPELAANLDTADVMTDVLNHSIYGPVAAAIRNQGKG